MESEYKKSETTHQAPAPWPSRESGGSKKGRVFGGSMLLIVGVLFLLRQMGFDYPAWIMSWPIVLIALSLYVGFRHSFKGPVWIVLFIVGVVFLVDRMNASFDFHRFLWPIILIAVGLILIFRPRKNHYPPAASWEPAGAPDSPEGNFSLDSVTVFGGVKKKVISKAFRGGDVVTIFGGSEIDLTQADVQGRIVLELTQIFAGTKLLVPPHWTIHSDDMVCIFGGLDDKRPVTVNPNYDPSKVLVLKGTCIFGGIDIKSY